MPSFKRGLNDHAFLLSDVVVSFCRDEAYGKIKNKFTSRLISDNVWLSHGPTITYKALTPL